MTLEGTYLVWVDCSVLRQASAEIVKDLLKKDKLWVNEGSLYGVAGEGFIRINTCGATLNEVVHEYHTLWIQAGIYFVLALIIYRFQIIRSRA